MSREISKQTKVAPIVVAIQQVVIIAALLLVVVGSVIPNAAALAVTMQSFFALTVIVEVFLMWSLTKQKVPLLGGWQRFIAEHHVPNPAATQPVAKTPQDLIVDSVEFTYAGAKSSTINQTSVFIGAGEVIALVGPNGSGKTTLIKLLIGALSPNAGEIWIGRDRVSPHGSTDGHFGVLFQDYARFSMSIRDTINMGDAFNHSDEAVWSALEFVDMANFVRRLPNSLDSVVGMDAADGIDLSGGQWQRLAIARLWIRDAPIWILDEPTSSLDPESEQKILNELVAKNTGKTIILVTHRLWTTTMADRIMVMKDGQVAEHGTFDELIARDGLFSDLFNYQVVEK